MNCQKCGGECWDNTQRNKERKAQGLKELPEFKCKDQNCAWVKWPSRNKQKPQPAALFSDGQYKTIVDMLSLINQKIDVAIGRQIPTDQIDVTTDDINYKLDEDETEF